MYLLFGIFFLICILFFIWNYRRKKCIIRKLCCMEHCEKVCILNELLCPFGFSYDPQQDIITSTTDAWQREFGYSTLFDRSAPHFHMVFDCEPIYFDYAGRTWRIEFWKGQYGINTGGEIGIYYADSVLKPERLDTALFHSVPDSQMLDISMELFYKGKSLFCIRRTHWWLTGFHAGFFSQPGDLTMKAAITFPHPQMLQAFTESLMHTGYGECAVFICGSTVSFIFAVPHTWQCRPPLRCRLSQWENRFFCRLYQRMTSPFDCTLDKLLYLYYFLPAAFRCMLHFRKSRKQKCRRKKRRNPS